MTLHTALEIPILIGSVGLMIFCFVLARRLRRLNDLEVGLGGAIAVMSAEVDRLEQTIRAARQDATNASEVLAEQIQHSRAERAHWKLHHQIQQVTQPEAARPPISKLRKRKVPADA